MKTRGSSVIRLATPVRAWAQRFALALMLCTAFGLMLMSRSDTAPVDRLRVLVVDAITPILELMAEPVATVTRLVGTAHELTDPAYRLPAISNTFHGRDIFAPAAAHLAAGVAVEKLGARVSDIVQLDTPKLEVQDSEIHGQVLHIDHFGNIITSIGELLWSDADHLTLTPRSGQTQP